jgi:hypothetical protein
VRNEHPEWVTTQGECPQCEDYALKLSRIIPADWNSALHASLTPAFTF